MRITCVSAEVFKDLWDTRIPSDKNLCDLTCRHFFDYTDNLLYLVSDDIKFINPPKKIVETLKIKRAREELDKLT